MKHKESLISAHHNYLVNNMLSPGFVLGDPGSNEDFYFLADLVLPGESTPRISARIFNGDGQLILEMNWNRITGNPGKCDHQSIAGGFRLLLPNGESLLEVNTQSFAKGFLTRVQGRLHDHQGRLRMEPSYEGIQIHGEAQLALDRPFSI